MPQVRITHFLFIQLVFFIIAFSNTFAGTNMVSKRFFDGGRYTIPTILKLLDLSYIFHYSGIDDEIVAEIRQKLKSQ